MEHVLILILMELSFKEPSTTTTITLEKVLILILMELSFKVDTAEYVDIYTKEF